MICWLTRFDMTKTSDHIPITLTTFNAAIEKILTYKPKKKSKVKKSRRVAKR